MRVFRGERSQSEFGDLVGRQRTQVSRLEDPAYGKWTLQTLFDVAEKLDVAVFVRFVDHSRFLRLSDTMDQEPQVSSLATLSASTKREFDHRKRPEAKHTMTAGALAFTGCRHAILTSAEAERGLV